MASNRRDSSPAQPRAVPGSAGDRQARRAPSNAGLGSSVRAASTARLASSPTGSSLPAPVGQIPVPSHLNLSGNDIPLAGPAPASEQSATGKSALATALEGSSGRSPPRLGTPPARPRSPRTDATDHTHARLQSPLGDLDAAVEGVSSSPRHLAPIEDAEIVKRHLVTLDDSAVHEHHASPALPGSPAFSHRPSVSVAEAPDLDEFSSLQLAGGDVHRQIYRWAEDADAQSRGVNKYRRTKSFHGSRPAPESDVLDINYINVPGGFRRNFLRRSGVNYAHPATYGTVEDEEEHSDENENDQTPRQPVMLTNSFIEFLTLYGHFAGEELDEDDEDDDESDDYFSHGDDGPGEGSALLTPRTPGGRRRQRMQRSAHGKNTRMGAALLLLKSFVGTGVLFLPRAFLNGGMLFSGVVLVGVAALSYYCFVLLVSTRLRVDGSFGDMGGMLYGRVMRALILSSIVLSQVGFVSAYIVFVSENLQAFVLAVSKCQTWINIKWMVLMQMVLFLPLSLIRDISKLGFTALVADVFILLGLVYLYYFDVSTIVANHGPADIVNFNPQHWTLFIGTAIFTFEGIGLIIPIQESMRKPTQFPPVLGFVMVIITIVFTSMGALSYAAYGSATKTVVILNLPQDSKFVNGVQFLYSLAILLSTPLQLFPAIRILETELFTRSGKNNPWVKWKKNVFRFFLVMACAMIAWVGANDLDKFVSLVGSFACVPLVYVYPPLLHLRAVARTRLQRTADIALSVVGFFVMVYTTGLTIQSWASSSDGPKGPEHCDL